MSRSRLVQARRLSVLPMTLALLAVGGCAEDAKSGSLTVTYRLGPTDDCGTFDVSKVRAVLGDPDDGIEEDAACGNDIIFPSVEEGTYSLLVEATDPTRFVVMDNFFDDESKMVEILGDFEREVEAQLTETPVYVWVRWKLYNEDGDFPVMCGDNDVEEFEVTAWNDARMLYSETLACEQEADDSDDQWRYLEDEDRDIVNTVNAVTITPQGAGLDHEPIPFMFSPPGPGRRLKFTITCNANVCTGIQD